LSKRRAGAEEIEQCEQRYTKSKTVHSITRHVAEKVSIDLEELYTLYVWPLYKQYGHAYEAFKIAILEPDQIFPKNVPTHIRNEFLKNIRKRLTPPPIKIRSDIEVSCYGYEGIDAVKQALIQGRDSSTEDCKIGIKLVAPPLYVMEATCIDRTKGIEIMEKAILEIERVIIALSGSCVVKMKPRVISQTDERELESLMAQAGQENNMDEDEYSE
jgi:translation initiation factor 2 subunit 1